MNRRTFLAASAAVAVAGAAPARSAFGVATTCYMTVRKFKDTLEFLEHCNSNGAAGIQSALTSTEPAYLDKLERRAKELGMYIEVMGPLPGSDISGFTRIMESAKKIGALCVRSSSPLGRRYEKFTNVEDWRKQSSESLMAIDRGVALANSLKMPWAIENHKEWFTEDYVSMCKKHSSEYFGVCLDTGNNIAMLDDPWEIVERLAPYAISSHIKDMGVAESPDGFLLSEVVLGEGMMGIRKVIATIQRARPKTRLTLEMITRDPLSVPCLTDKYWASFPDRSGVHLARTLRMVREKKSKLPMLSGMDRAAQMKEEEENVKKCLAFSV